MEPRGSLLCVGARGANHGLDSHYDLLDLCALTTYREECRCRKRNTCGPSFAFFSSPITVLKLKRLVTAQINNQNDFGFMAKAKLFWSNDIQFFYSNNAPHVIYK